MTRLHEGHLASVLGEDTLRGLYETSLGLTIPVPIAGTPFYAVNGDIIAEPPRMQDVRGRRLYEFPNAREAARPVGWGKGSRAIMPIAGGGFASIADLVAERDKAQYLPFTKGASGTKVASRGWSYWQLGTLPAAGTNGGTTGTGQVRGKSASFNQNNAATGESTHIADITFNASQTNQIGLFYDRLWDMTHTMTVDPRSCDAANVPTRYQTATTAPGSFIAGEVTTILPAATPTVTFDYVDQDGNNVTGPALSTIESGAAVNSIPFTAGKWAYPLDPADTGVRSLQNSANAVNLSAAMASGVVTWFIGHPLAVLVTTANTTLAHSIDGINSVFNLQRVYDNACLAFLEPSSPSTSSTTWTGTIHLVSG